LTSGRTSRDGTMPVGLPRWRLGVYHCLTPPRVAEAFDSQGAEMTEGDDRVNVPRPAGRLDEQLQREIDEALGGKSIEELIEPAIAPPSGRGQVRAGKVVSVGKEDIFVDLGGRSEGVVPVAQFEDQPLPAVGDEIQVTIEGYDQDDGLLLLSRQGAITEAAWETLEEGQVVEGRVTGSNKGGLELTVDGIRAFMPVSQIEMFRVEDLSQYFNQRMRCQVVELDRAERNVIVSRRAILELEVQQKREEFWGGVVEGQTVTGTVRSIMPYGAFVTISEGVDGLLHVKDMSHARVEDPGTIVKQGQKLELMIIKVDREARKIGLGLKQLLADPWSSVEEKYSEGDLVSGRVTRLAEFGAFVEVEPGMEGLIPMGEMSFEWRIKSAEELVKPGDVIKVRVLTIDKPRKRISLSLKRVGDDPWLGAAVRWPENSIVTGIVKRIAEFGAFVEIVPGVEGLVHISELSWQHVRSAAEAVQPGLTVRAKVLAVDEDQRRISLSIKQAGDSAPEPSGLDEAQQQPQKQQPKRKKPLKGGLD